MQNEHIENNKKQSKLPLLISLGIIVFLIAAYFFLPSVHQQVNEGFHALMSKNKHRTEAWVRQFGLWGPLVIIMAMTLQTFLLFVPNFLLMIVAVICYGPWWGALISVLSVFSAASAGYFTGMYLGPYSVNKLIGEKTRKKIQGWVKHYGISVVVVIRTSPLLPNDALHFVAGLLRMGYWRFILATVAGTIPLAAIIAIFAGNGKVDKGVLWTSVISTAVFILYLLIDYINRRKKKSLVNRTA